MNDDPRLEALEAELIQPGWEVWSNDGDRVGIVRAVGAQHLALELEILPGRPLAVPLDEVESADGGRVELDVPAEGIGLMGWGDWAERAPEFGEA